MFWKWLAGMFFDTKAEDNPAGGEGGEGGAPGDGQGDAPTGDEGAGDPAGSGDGQGGTPPNPSPAFGEFGDAPQSLEEANSLAKKLYENLTKIKPEFETLRGKTAATERNLALTRKALESSGLRAVRDEEGNIRFEPIPQDKRERTRRFNDDVVKRLATHFQGDINAARGFVDLLLPAVQDAFEDLYEGKQTEMQKSQEQRRVFQTIQKRATTAMLSYFPQLDPKVDEGGKPTNPEFNEAFYNRATEIWENDPHLRRNPQGELLAALEAARELNIPTLQAVQQKKEGFEQGKQQKKILGPVSQGKQPAGSKGKLSKEEYLKLTPEEREKYDRQSVGL